MSKETVEVTIELTNEEIAILALEAHERNMTLNDFIVEILTEQIREEKKE